MYLLIYYYLCFHFFFVLLISIVDSANHMIDSVLSSVFHLLQISALVTMYSHEEDIDSAIDVLSQAIQYYQREQVCWERR